MSNSFNDYADYWRYEIGVNVIPADTKNKTTWIKWEQYQDNPILESQHEQWKKDNEFDKGMAIIAGKVWHNLGKKGLYLNFIDTDNQKGIDEFCTRNGKTIPLEQISQKIIVEQHKDDLSKAHFYFYSHSPLNKKSSDKSDTNEIPKIEVKGQGSHGIAYCTPSLHKNGFNYEIIGTKEPEAFDDMQDHLNSIFTKYNLNYDNNLLPIKDLFKPDTIVHQGQNRHEALLRAIESLLRRNKDILTLEEIIQLAHNWNHKHCDPPLEPREFQRQWQSATNYVNRKERKEDQDQYTNEQQQTTETILEEKHQQEEYGNLTKDQFEKELTEKYHFKSMKDNGELWYYNGKIFVKDADWIIQRECIRFNPASKTSDVNDTLNHIKWSNYIDRDAFDPDIKWLCFDNCMVNLLTGETAKHNPKFMTTVQIPHKYIDLHKTPHIPAPQKILQFFNEVIVNPDKIETMFDFMAYCLWRAFPYHRWLLLNGWGRNGKGVTTNIITKLLGENNVSSEELQRILKNNFATANLHCKMANIDADLSSEELKQTGRLKKLTGNDRMMAEFKFKPAFSFRSYTKLIFSANEMPLTPDETDAFFVRLLIINFPNQFLGDKSNPNKLAEITTPEEMSLLLSFLIRRLPRVLKNGISYKDNIEENRVKWIQSADPIRLFIELSISRQVGGYETKDGVYDAYKIFCTDKNLPAESQETFSRRLKEAGFDYKRKSLKGLKVYAWENIKLEDYRIIERKQATLDSNEVDEEEYV